MLDYDMKITDDFLFRGSLYASIIAFVADADVKIILQYTHRGPNEVFSKHGLNTNGESTADISRHKAVQK